MPQFEQTGLFLSQIFWLIVTFAALYWVMAKMAIPRVGEVLEQRARVIQDDLDRAAALKAETDAAIAAYEKAMNEARAQASEQMRAIQADVKAVADKRTAEIAAAVSKQVSEAEARIAKAKSDAMAGLATVAAETARDVVAKLAGLSPDAGTLDGAVKAALKESR